MTSYTILALCMYFNVLGLLAQMFQKLILKVKYWRLILKWIILYWQSKSSTNKGLVWFGLIIPQAYIEKPQKAIIIKNQPIQPLLTPTHHMYDWLIVINICLIIGMMMGNVCFGDDFWAVIQYVLLGEFVGLKMRFSIKAWHKMKRSLTRRSVYALVMYWSNNWRSYLCLIRC